MPIYEYQCADCGHRLEALQKISDSPLKNCPACVSTGLTRLVSASSFRLKGGGWYETDFKTGNKRHGTQSDSAAAATAPAGASGTEAKKASTGTVASGSGASSVASSSGGSGTGGANKSAAASE